MVEKIFEELSALDEVEAIALGGSRAGEVFDAKSDYDVYVYCTAAIPESVRADILKKYCGRMEIGNSFWEYEDNCVLNSGVDIDILYRDLDEFVKGVSEVVDGHLARNCYTTCMWHNLKTCKIVYDGSGRLTEYKKRYSCAYPKELKANIISRGMKLIRNAMPAFEVQIEKAVGRGDVISMNHRVTEFFAAYFDVIFAMNELTHPGEKRLVELCEKNCKILPDDFRGNIERLLHDLFGASDRVSSDLDSIITALERKLKESGN